MTLAAWTALADLLRLDLRLLQLDLRLRLATRVVAAGAVGPQQKSTKPLSPLGRIKQN
jgi:hypothetical protein